MKTQITNLPQGTSKTDFESKVLRNLTRLANAGRVMKCFLVAVVATLAIAATASAQQQAVVGTQGPQSPRLSVVTSPQNQFYFGMRVELVRNWGGTTLRVVGVDYGSPAQRAGLEFGDEIRTVNGQGFSAARDSFEAVRMMNQFASYQIGVPASSAPAAAAAYIGPMPSPNPIAQMIVRNVRNGQNVAVTVRPTSRGYGGAPAAAASTAARN